MTILFATGWEHGDITWMTKTSGSGSASIESTIIKTGNHSCEIPAAAYRLNLGLGESEIYLSAWVYPSSIAVDKNAIYARFSDGVRVGIKNDADGHWDAYVDGSKVADGVESFVIDTWHHVMLYVKIADGVDGRISTYIDGVDDLAYEGDTKPAAITTMDDIEIAVGSGATLYVDDLVVGTGGWLGDLRISPMLVNEDTATVQWDLSTGISHFGVVDEHPPSDADYSYTGVTAEKEKLATANVALGTSTPVALQTWVRARKDTADANQIKIIIDDGTEDASAALDLATSFAYYTRVDETKPSGGAWDQTSLDALVLGVESVIA